MKYSQNEIKKYTIESGLVHSHAKRVKNIVILLLRGGGMELIHLF